MNAIMSADKARFKNGDVRASYRSERDPDNKKLNDIRGRLRLIKNEKPTAKEICRRLRHEGGEACRYEAAYEIEHLIEQIELDKDVFKSAIKMIYELQDKVKASQKENKNLQVILEQNGWVF